MSLCDDIRAARSGKEIAQIVERDERFISWRDSGSSHRIAKFENGASIPIPVHGNRDIPLGTKLKIIRLLRAAGLCSILVGAIALLAAKIIGS